MSSHAPAELVMFGAAVGLSTAGISEDDFLAAAPVAGCRVCGALFQTKFHRRLYHERLLGFDDDPDLLSKILEMNARWRQKHTLRKHTNDEINALTKTGAAFTPEAANKLAPFGIFPMGNLNQEIMDAMYEAPRAPDMTNLEGGE